jgi:hypothetical protein
MNEKTKLTIDLNNEIITIYNNRTRVGDLKFLIDETQIIVSDLTIVDENQLQGYGCLLLNAIKGVAQHYKKPIYLISNPDKIRFYEKMDFFSMNILVTYSWFYSGVKVNIKNLNPDKPIKEQISIIDMLWIPNNIKEVEVYL